MGLNMSEDILDNVFDWNDDLLWPDYTDDLYKGVMYRRAPVKGFEDKYKGGQFIPASKWEEQKALARASLPKILVDFSKTMQVARKMWVDVNTVPGNQTTPGQVRWLMKSLIRKTYEEAFMAGKRSGGNLFAITNEDKKAIMKVRYDEFKYLENFMRDMSNGGGVMDYQKRMDYYVKAARELYWLGFVRSNMDATRIITWRTNPEKEHCKTCISAAAGGPYTAEDFWKNLASKGILPHSGRLECLGYHCGCWLEDETPESNALKRGAATRLRISKT